jgi:hypothetical protein
MLTINRVQSDRPQKTQGGARRARAAHGLSFTTLLSSSLEKRKKKENTCTPRTDVPDVPHLPLRPVGTAAIGARTRRLHTYKNQHENEDAAGVDGNSESAIDGTRSRAYPRVGQGRMPNDLPDAPAFARCRRPPVSARCPRKSQILIGLHQWFRGPACSDRTLGT